MSSRLLLVEGEDERNFFTSLCNHLGLTDIQILPYNGKPNLPNVFAAVLNHTNFDKIVKAYAITRDADTSQVDAYISIKGLLARHSQPCPSKHAEFASGGSRKVGIFIMPGNNAPNGMLEDLCLETVAEHDVMGCVDNFMHCLKTKTSLQYPKNESKARVQVFLAAMPEIANSLGVGAQKKYWQFDHSALQELRNFLLEFTK